MRLDKLVEVSLFFITYLYLLTVLLDIIKLVLKKIWNTQDNHVIHHDKYLL